MSVLMIQGTSASVGKTVICAGLCRIFARKGYSVAPFKPVSTSPFSADCKTGAIARSVMMQAQAAKTEASTLMNPIFARTIDANTFELFVNGSSAGEIEYKMFSGKMAELKEAVQASYEKLTKMYDIVIIEGSGSPAEFIANDLANMGIAKMSGAPVLLVGDIDRGGVFATLSGTLALLNESDKTRVKGLLINKFRGDVALLTNGLDMITDITGVPVLGVLPYIRLAIEEEDLLGDGDPYKTYSDELRESELDKWVELLEQALNMEAVYKLMGLKN